MDDRPKRLIIVSVAILLLIILALVGWNYWTKRGAPSAGAPTPSNGGLPTTLPTGSQPNPVPQTPPVSEAQGSAMRLARLFVERFGTFTSQGQFEGIAELRPLTTSSMGTWMSGTYIPGLRQKYPANTYAAQTTQVLGLDVEKSTDEDATILVRTQQTFVRVDEAPIITNPSMRLGLVKNGDFWFVDNAVWTAARNP